MVIIIVTGADTFVPEEVEDVEEQRHGVDLHNVGAEGAAVVPRLIPRALHEGVHQHAAVAHGEEGAGAVQSGVAVHVFDDFFILFGHGHRLGANM